MDKNNDAYQLNFVIPKGETGNAGPKGETGNQGPNGDIGPINLQEITAFVEYQPSNVNGTLQIANVTFSPEETDTFQRNENIISLYKKGYYEFNISGILRESQNSNQASFILRTQHQANYDNYITVRIGTEMEKRYFTYKRIKRFSYPQDISLLLNKTDDSDASIEKAVLVIKKLPF